MLKLTTIILIISLVGLTIGGDAARMYLVDDDGPSQYKSISEAVDAANDGDTIRIKPGTYREHLTLEKSISIMPLPGENEECLLSGDGNEIGIKILADGCIIEGLTITNFRGPGIYVASNGNEIKKNVFKNNVHGIFLNESSNNNIESNKEIGGYAGIVLFGAKENTIKENSAEDCKLAGIVFNSAQNNVVTNSVCKECERGFYLHTSSNDNELISSKVENSTTSIVVDSCSGNKIQGNVILNSTNGISLLVSNNNSISDNQLSKLGDGIMVLDSSANKLVGNNINEADSGIMVWNSSKNALEKNVLIDVGLGIHVDGSSEVAFDNQIAESNSLEGKPILYHYGQSNLNVRNRECAHITLAHCDGCTIEDNVITNDALFVYSSKNNQIRGNEISNVYGMYVRDSLNNQIVENQVCNNKYNGMFLINSSFNQIYDNVLNQNAFSGIFLSDASDTNEIIGNSFEENRLGVNLNQSNQNVIYHNNFVKNANQAEDRGDNLWDWGVLVGGNYWSDHQCVGNPCQNLPREIGNTTADYYPFQDRDGWL